MNWGLGVAVRRADERGAAAVELALIFPLLVSLLFGIIWFGFVYADHIAVSNAVREGARYGAAADAANANWASNVATRVGQVYFDAEGAGASVTKVCVRLVDGTTGSPVSGQSSIPPEGCGTEPAWPPPAATNLATGSCVVKVWASKPRTIHLVVFPDLNLNLGASSVAYYGRTVTACPATP